MKRIVRRTQSNRANYTTVHSTSPLRWMTCFPVTLSTTVGLLHRRAEPRRYVWMTESGVAHTEKALMPSRHLKRNLHVHRDSTQSPTRFLRAPTSGAKFTWISGQTPGSSSIKQAASGVIFHSPKSHSLPLGPSIQMRHPLSRLPQPAVPTQSSIADPPN